ncbi:MULTISPECIES: AIPR family protein [Mammaliicoccus]|uniref:AIPR family protein n=1 Tax=Mammaliicoccus TaxID=2803850 RepID=UPI0015F68C37|nr:AIPR family protein [Mammaliicoccus lentus]QMU12022.1 AIPR family protein [Mammaliicoccus lentus]WGZ44684.1 AIPR family protein [Mammaliicoccus lentus]WHI56029.1 AIPR family protein [Mammaliicoccus lentus]WHI58529.1 AIPR family protein [Mammaliicoccus lentus]WHI66375.1 AIPR family protein [Mammaliicoccus lentus]
MKSNDDRDFFNNIAEATNSQKAIQPKDLKANAPEMIQLQRILYDEGIFMEIKRGITAPRSHSNSKIKNEEFAQLFYSFVNQRPGTARSSKKSLFSNNSHYKSIFKLNYSNDQVKVEFIKDLINLNQRVNYIIQNIKEHNSVGLSTEEMTILVNGKYSLIAIMGVIYRIVNNDPGAKSIEDLHGDDFKFGTFISNYENDDIDDKLKDLIVEFVEILATSYEREFSFGNVTSPSNFFKTDKKYLEKIADKVIKDQRVSRKHNELISAYGPLFKRVSSRDIDKK